MKKCKIKSNGVQKGSCDILFTFWDPLHISGTVEANNFKSGTYMDHKEHLTKNATLGQRVSGRGHVAYFSNFGPLHISVMVEARNFKQVDKSIQIEQQSPIIG